tara:strand:+ start:185 stop:373 length:189 start_codon:yes stop_codon:yes gene_type:complete
MEHVVYLMALASARFRMRIASQLAEISKVTNLIVPLPIVRNLSVLAVDPIGVLISPKMIVLL